LRAALGAGRWRLVRLFLIEGLLLAGAGAVAGFLAARWSTGGIVALAGEQLPPGIPVRTDAWVLLFCAVAAVFSAVISAVFPALQATRLDLQSALKEAGSATGYAVPRRRNLPMVWEVALALVLVMGALALLRSVRVLNPSDLGFDHERALTCRSSVSRSPKPRRAHSSSSPCSRYRFSSVAWAPACAPA
jgi:putative ABC transport system permease protein